VAAAAETGLIRDIDGDDLPDVFWMDQKLGGFRCAPAPAAGRHRRGANGGATLFDAEVSTAARSVGVRDCPGLAQRQSGALDNSADNRAPKRELVTKSTGNTREKRGGV